MIRPKPVKTDTTPVSAPANTDEARQDEVTTANHSEGSNEASGLIRADDLVPAINEAADALIHTEVSRLKAILLAHIAIGKLLNKAKDTLEHGAWTTWFEPEDKPKKFKFSMRKAQRCMRFADYEPELLAWAENRQQLAVLAAEEQLGVEDAENFIKELKAAEKARAEAKAAADLEAALGKIDADKAAEIIGRVWEKEKHEQFVAIQLKAMLPERILSLLLGAFGYEQLENLSEQLSTHLRSHANLSHVN
jgi:hypothetical protein